MCRDRAGDRALILRRAKHLAWRRVLDETVVLDLERRVAYGFDDAAATVLAWMGAPIARERLLRAAGTLAGAVEGFLEALEANGLVVKAESDGPLRDLERLDAPPTILWCEPLPELVQQASPPMEIGTIQCFQ